MGKFVSGASDEQRWVPEPLAELNVPLTAVQITAARAFAEQIRSYVDNADEAIDWFLHTAEAAASSDVEDVHPTLVEVTTHEFIGEGTDDARATSANMSALRKALSIGATSGTITVDDIRSIHIALTEPLIDLIVRDRMGLRQQQNYEPGFIREIDNRVVTPTIEGGWHFYYPPPAIDVQWLMEDLLAFMRRTDLEPIVHAAIAHVRFEEIHPFLDGNGRAGRALVHTMLGKAGLIDATVTLPLSASLALRKLDYYDALRAMQVETPLETTPAAFTPIIDMFGEAVTTALERGTVMRTAMRSKLEAWRQTLRGTRLGGRIIEDLPRSPVVDVESISDSYGVSATRARRVLADLAEAGALRRCEVGQAGRVVWQATGLLDSFSAGMRGVLSTVRTTQSEGTANWSTPDAELLTMIDDAEHPPVAPGRAEGAPTDQHDVCGKFMPRAKAYCVLAARHAGACRSTLSR